MLIKHYICIFREEYFVKYIVSRALDNAWVQKLQMYTPFKIIHKLVFLVIQFKHPPLIWISVILSSTVALLTQRESFGWHYCPGEKKSKHANSYLPSLTTFLYPILNLALYM